MSTTTRTLAALLAASLAFSSVAHAAGSSAAGAALIATEQVDARSERAGPIPSANPAARSAEGSPVGAPGRPMGDSRSAQHEGSPMNAPASPAHARLFGALERSDLAAALAARGLSVDQARDRVAALSDAEAAQLAAQIDRAPAGADGILGTLVFIFVLLLVTDILGLTKVFPFTRSVR